MNRTLRRQLGAACVLATISLAGVASYASATTEPPAGTEPMGTETMGTETMGTETMGTETMGTETMGTETMGTEAMGTEAMGEEMTGPYGPLCAAVPADGEGSVAGMADDPVGTAASNNPLLSTLVAAVTAAELGDTLNSAGPFTVFAPINSAFDKIDPATLETVLADTEMLTSILTYHVIPEQLSAADLVAGGTFATVNGGELSFAQVGETIVINGGASAVQCADVPTANATVFLIDTVLMPEG